MSRPFIAYYLLCTILLLSSCSDSTRVIIPPPRPSPPAIDASPKCSSDGLKIIYYHAGIDSIFDDGTYTVNPDSAGLWMINPDGTQNHLILRTGPADIDWSPDGCWIALSVYGRVYKAKIDADTVDVASIQALTDDGDGPCFWPSWSPDGGWIAYDCTPENHDAVWRVKSDGSNKVKIRDYARDPDFAPLGNRILYLKWFGQGVPEIFSMDMNTSEETQITHLRKEIRSPEYSADAARVLFCDYNICIMDSNGSNLRRINNVVGYDPSWGPSGREIIFIRPNYADWRDNGLVYIMNDDGSDLRRLTRGIK